MIFSVAVGATLLLADAWPPEPVTLIVALCCFALGLYWFFRPYLAEHEAQVRIAEAHVRDHLDAQLRSLKQSTEQLTNAVSRSQASEEQAGQTLGSIEELSDKLAAQAEELAQTLARSNEREVAKLKTDVERLVQERDERLAALDQRLDTVTGQLSEHQLATRRSANALGKTLDEVKERMIALAARLDEVAQGTRSMPAVASARIEPAPATAVAESPASPAAPAPAKSTEPAQTSEPAAIPATEVFVSPATVAEKAPAEPFVASAPVVVEPIPVAPAAVAPPAAKPRVRRAPATPPTAAPAAAPVAVKEATPVLAPAAASRIVAKPQPLDLPLLDLTQTRPVAPSRSESSAGASTVVATAYIGIGNKLYVRGEGPGLSWDQGVPMQFLAIGKWGWTSPDSDSPITCRIYRNDDTPMLDENITIAPGTKAEITPRF
jgi:Skp family chaperone for outer membrane proteins